MSRTLVIVIAAAVLAATLPSPTDAAQARVRHGLQAPGWLPAQPLRLTRSGGAPALFARFRPCLVWTRQGWTDLCRGGPR